MTINQYYDHKQATKDLNEYGDLQSEFMRQPGLFAYYNSLLVQAELQFSNLSHKIEVMEAALATKLRDTARAAGDKLTEAQAKERVAMDPRVRDAYTDLNEAKAEVGFLKGTVTALAQRKDMLMQMGFAQRKEVDSQSGNMMVMKTSMKENQQARMARLSDLGTDLDDFS